MKTQFITKIGGKTSLGPSYSLCRIFIPSYMFDGLLFETGSLLPINNNSVVRKKREKSLYKPDIKIVLYRKKV